MQQSELEIMERETGIEEWNIKSLSVEKILTILTVNSITKQYSEYLPWKF